MPVAQVSTDAARLRLVIEVLGNQRKGQAAGKIPKATINLFYRLIVAVCGTDYEPFIANAFLRQKTFNKTGSHGAECTVLRVFDNTNAISPPSVASSSMNELVRYVLNDDSCGQALYEGCEKLMRELPSRETKQTLKRKLGESEARADKFEARADKFEASAGRRLKRLMLQDQVLQKVKAEIRALRRSIENGTPEEEPPQAAAKLKAAENAQHLKEQEAAAKLKAAENAQRLKEQEAAVKPGGAGGGKWENDATRKLIQNHVASNGLTIRQSVTEDKGRPYYVCMNDGRKLMYWVARDENGKYRPGYGQHPDTTMAIKLLQE